MDLLSTLTSHSYSKRSHTSDSKNGLWTPVSPPVPPSNDGAALSQKSSSGPSLYDSNNAVNSFCPSGTVGTVQSPDQLLQFVLGTPIDSFAASAPTPMDSVFMASPSLPMDNYPYHNHPLLRFAPQPHLTPFTQPFYPLQQQQQQNIIFPGLFSTLCPSRSEQFFNELEEVASASRRSSFSISPAPVTVNPAPLFSTPSFMEFSNPLEYTLPSRIPSDPTGIFSVAPSPQITETFPSAAHEDVKSTSRLLSIQNTNTSSPRRSSLCQRVPSRNSAPRKSPIPDRPKPTITIPSPTTQLDPTPRTRPTRAAAPSSFQTLSTDSLDDSDDIPSTRESTPFSPTFHQSTTQSASAATSQETVPTSLESALESSTSASTSSSTYKKWTPDEDALLHDAVMRVTRNDPSQVTGKWPRISTLVPGRTPIQCSARWTGALNTEIVRGKWTPVEDELLTAAVESAVEASVDGLDGVNWQVVAGAVVGRTAVQCAARYQEALDPGVRKGKWSLQEDELLTEGLKKYGKSWVKIAAEIPNRTQRQCRTRWLQVFPRLSAEEKDHLERVCAGPVAVNEKVKKKKQRK